MHAKGPYPAFAAEFFTVKLNDCLVCTSFAVGLWMLIHRHHVHFCFYVHNCSSSTSLVCITVPSGKAPMVPRPLPSHCKSARRMCLFVFQHVCLLVLLHIFSARLLFSPAFCYPKWRDITCFHMCSHVSKFGHTRSRNLQISSRKLLIVC